MGQYKSGIMAVMETDVCIRQNWDCSVYGLEFSSRLVDSSVALHKCVPFPVSRPLNHSHQIPTCPVISLNVTPVSGTYYGTCIGVLTANIMASIIVLNIQYKGVWGFPVPAWLR